MNEVVTGDVQAEAPVDIPVTDQGPPTPPEPQQEAPKSDGEGRRSAISKALETAGVTERTRGPDGKFTSEAKPAEKPAIEDRPVTLDEPKADAKPEIAAPPSRFSADAKAAWAAAPDAIKGEVHRAIRELESGIQQKDAMLEPLKPYFDLAKQHGTTVDTALGNYVRLEQLIIKDPRAGLEALAKNLGTDLPRLFAMAGFKPGQAGQPQPQTAPEIQQMRDHIANLEAELKGIKQSNEQQLQTQTMREVEAFSAKHSRFDELAPEIQKLLETGYADTLEEAYEKAVRLNPAPLPAPAVAAPPAQPRPARSVTGAPTPGSNPAAGRPSESRREAVSNALARVGLG